MAGNDGNPVCDSTHHLEAPQVEVYADGGEVSANVVSFVHHVEELCQAHLSSITLRREATACCSELSSGLEAMRQELDTAKRQLRDSQDQVKSLSEERDTALKAHEQCRADLGRSRNSEVRLSKSLASFGRELRETKERLQEVTRQAEANKQQLKKQNEDKCRELDSRCKRLAYRHTVAKKDHLKTQEELTKASKMEAELADKLDAMRRELDQIRKDASQAQIDAASKLTESQRKVQQLERQIKESAEATRKKVTCLKGDLSKLQSERDALEQEAVKYRPLWNYFFDYMAQNSDPQQSEKIKKRKSVPASDRTEYSTAAPRRSGRICNITI